MKIVDCIDFTALSMENSFLLKGALKMIELQSSRVVSLSKHVCADTQIDATFRSRWMFAGHDSYTSYVCLGFKSNQSLAE